MNCVAASAGVTNGIPDWLITPSLTWGTATNQVRAGISFSKSVAGKKGAPQIAVMLLTSKTNTAWDYVKPPKKKFSKVELCDPAGLVLRAVPGKELDGELPKQIAVEGLPRIAPRPRKGRGLRDWLNLTPNGPVVLEEFSVQEIYKIRKEGDYKLSVWPVVYKMSLDQQSVSRLDIPCVTAVIHLIPDEVK